MHRMGAINFIELTLKKWSHKLEPQAIRTRIVELTNTLAHSENYSQSHNVGFQSDVFRELPETKFHLYFSQVKFRNTIQHERKWKLELNFGSLRPKWWFNN